MWIAAGLGMGIGIHLSSQSWDSICPGPVQLLFMLLAVSVSSYMSQSIVSRRSCFSAAFQPHRLFLIFLLHRVPWALKGGRGWIAVSHLGLGVPRSLTLHVASCGISCVSLVSDEFPYCHFQEHERLKWLYQLLTTYKCLRKSEAPWESPYSMTCCWWAQSCTDLVQLMSFLEVSIPTSDSHFFHFLHSFFPFFYDVP